VDDVRAALYASKVIAYAQGFDLIVAGAKEFGWNIDLGALAKIWRAGCIIRSRFLDQMAAAYSKGGAANLLMVPDFVAIMKDANQSLRRIVSAAALGEFPMICLSASLAYFDSFRQAQGTANLTQGQRDFFGAHGFELIDRQGEQHGTWPSTLGK
jgi:6-phosphogluconate dehydrogenase